MGLRFTKVTGGIENEDIKEDTNNYYTTYGREGEVDYIEDYNGEEQPSDLFFENKLDQMKKIFPKGYYQPSHYDEMEDNSGGNNKQSEVLILEKLSLSHNVIFIM